MFAYDSITVSSAWELTSVSMRYSQGEGVNTSLSRTMYYTHDWFQILVVYSICLYLWSFRSFPVWRVWLSSVVRSCATRDASNKGYVWKPTIPAGINCPLPSETISHVTRVPDHQTLGIPPPPPDCINAALRELPEPYATNWFVKLSTAPPPTPV